MSKSENEAQIGGQPFPSLIDTGSRHGQSKIARFKQWSEFYLDSTVLT